MERIRGQDVRFRKADMEILTDFKRPVEIRVGRANKNDLPEELQPLEKTDYIACAYVSRGRQCKSKAWFGGYCRQHMDENQAMEMFAMGILGEPIEIDPEDALLVEVHRTAGHVEWLRHLVASFDPESDLENDLGSDLLELNDSPLGLTQATWLKIYQEERKHLVKASNAAIASGVSERKVFLKAEHARQIATILQQFLLSENMNFTPEQLSAANIEFKKLLAGANVSGEGRKVSLKEIASGEDEKDPEFL